MGVRLQNNDGTGYGRIRSAIGFTPSQNVARFGVDVRLFLDVGEETHFNLSCDVAAVFRKSTLIAVTNSSVGEQSLNWVKFAYNSLHTCAHIWVEYTML